MASYKDMLDSAFSTYYDRFRKLRALSEETAVTREELFPDGESMIDRDRMHKMLSMAIVKRVDADRYWLDEKRAADGKGVLKQRPPSAVGSIEESSTLYSRVSPSSRVQRMVASPPRICLSFLFHSRTALAL